MLVDNPEILINTIKKAEAVRYLPHCGLLKIKTPNSSPHTKNTGIKRQVKNAVNLRAFSISFFKFSVFLL